MIHIYFCYVVWFIYMTAMHELSINPGLWTTDRINRNVQANYFQGIFPSVKLSLTYFRLTAIIYQVRYLKEFKTISETNQASEIFSEIVSFYSQCYLEGFYWCAASSVYYVCLIYKPFFFLINIWLSVFESLWCANVLYLTLFQSRYKERKTSKCFFPPSPTSSL